MGISLDIYDCEQPMKFDYNPETIEKKWQNFWS